MIHSRTRVLGAAMVAGCAILAAGPRVHASPAPPPRIESPAPHAEEEPESSALEVIPWNSALTGNLHNKIVHFPLALGMAAALMLMVAPRWPVYSPAARVLLMAAALAAIAAYLTGTRQEEPFEGSPFEALVELHEAFGIGTGVVLWTGVALTFAPRARRLLPFYGGLLLLVLIATGFLGGVLSHS